MNVAACPSVSAGGTIDTRSAGATISVANPPTPLVTSTRSPTAGAPTPSPTSVTTPTLSPPAMNGSGGLIW